jgi:hypothetical protein
MQPPRHPATHFAALAVFLIGAAAGCCGDADDDSAALADEDGDVPVEMDEAAFVAQHTELLCEKFLPDLQGLEIATTSDACPAEAEVFLRTTAADNGRIYFVPEIAVACHSEVSGATEYELWTWCFPAWQG